VRRRYQVLIRFIHSGVSWILLSGISADGAEREREREKKNVYCVTPLP